MRPLFFIFISVMLVTNVFAQDVAKASLTSEEYQALLKQTILPIPDSALTKKQVELKIKLLDVLHENISIEDNCQVLAVEKSAFEEAGIPPIYYDVIKYQIEETNKAVKKWEEKGIIPASCLNQDSLMKIAKERYWNVERPLLLERTNK